MIGHYFGAPCDAAQRLTLDELFGPGMCDATPALLEQLWTAKDEADCETWRAAKVKAWEAGEKIKEKQKRQEK